MIFFVFAQQWQLEGGNLSCDFDNNGTVNDIDLKTFMDSWYSGKPVRLLMETFN